MDSLVDFRKMRVGRSLLLDDSTFERRLDLQDIEIRDTISIVGTRLRQGLQVAPRGKAVSINALKAILEGSAEISGYWPVGLDFTDATFKQRAVFSNMTVGEIPDEKRTPNRLENVFTFKAARFAEGVEFTDVNCHLELILESMQGTRVVRAKRLQCWRLPSFEGTLVEAHAEFGR